MKNISMSVLGLGAALLFLAMAVFDFLKSESKLTIARRTWLRLALIFAGVAIGLEILLALLSG